MVTESINVNNESGEISIKELVIKIRRWYQYLLSKWMYLLIVGFIGGILGFTYSYFKKPIYTASTSFVLESGESSGGLGQYAGLASMVGLDMGGGGGGIFQGDNILELYKSRTMIEKTLLSEIKYKGRNMLLIDCYLDFSGKREAWMDIPQLKNLTFKLATNEKAYSRLQDSIIGLIVTDINKSGLVVSKPDKKLSIINVEVKANDEIFAKLFNDQIVKNVNDFYVQTKTKKSLDNVIIMQKKTDSVRNVMNGAIYSAAIVADETPNLNPTRGVQRAAPIQRSQFSAETNKAVLSELLKNLEMSKMALLKETPLIQVVDHPIYPLTKDVFGKKKGFVLGFLMFFILGAATLTFVKMFKSILS